MKNIYTHISSHDHGNCELCDALEKEHEQMTKLLKCYREALEEYAECSDGCTCGDGWGHSTAMRALGRLK